MERLAGPGEAGRCRLPWVWRGDRGDRGRQAEGAGGALQQEAEGDRGAEQGDVQAPGGAGDELRPLPVPLTPPPSVRSSARGETQHTANVVQSPQWNHTNAVGIQVHGFCLQKGSAIFALRQIVGRRFLFNRLQLRVAISNCDLQFTPESHGNTGEHCRLQLWFLSLIRHRSNICKRARQSPLSGALWQHKQQMISSVCSVGSDTLFTLAVFNK